MIDSDIPLFFISKGKKKILFKNDSWWINSSLGRLIAKNKGYAYKIFEYYHIPYPKTLIIHNPKEINQREIKKNIWYPLVVKPSDRGCGKWISIVFHPSQFIKAIKQAQKFWSNIIIQKFIPWNDHRIMVVGDKVIAGLMRVPASVIWNGKATIRKLIQEKNKSKERGKNCDVSILTKVKITPILKEYLKNKYGYTLETIPKKSKKIYLIGNSNLSTWWDAQDITDTIHPEFKKICCRIAKICVEYP